MGFIRPEAKATILQWREALIGGTIVIAGVLVGVKYYGTFLHWPAILIVALGMYLLKTGIDRARYNVKYDGEGVVDVTERRMTYFSAEGGSSFSLNDVVKIEIETTEDGPFDEDMFWVFYFHSEPAVRIPASAAEGQGIFDALTVFSGVNFENVVRASGSTVCDRFLIWKKDH